VLIAGPRIGSADGEIGRSIVPIEYSQVRKGMVIVGEGGQLFHVLDRDLNTPGNWRAQLKLKLKNLKTGAITEEKVRPQDMEYIYQEAAGFVFMDTETYDQITLPGDMVDELMLYMKPNTKAYVTFYEGKPLSLELPATVELEVTETEPAVKGATAAAQYKPATLETGLKITVPPFIGVGEKIKVDTRSGEYLERVK
jgi:elongation factor P